jgi:hypothetical protein
MTVLDLSVDFSTTRIRRISPETTTLGQKLGGLDAGRGELVAGLSIVGV